MLLIFIHPSLVEIGQATFLGAILLFAVPPASILFIYLLAAFSLLLGMCLAWCWGLLTMKAALATRSDAETQAKLQALQQQAEEIAKTTGQAPAWEAQYGLFVHLCFGTTAVRESEACSHADLWNDCYRYLHPLWPDTSEISRRSRRDYRQTWSHWNRSGLSMLLVALPPVNIVHGPRSD
ncbi:Amino-acid permease GAP5 [Fusarium oxysporum f. sp. albedinis]|nr:Amino-acid permease GAP5 [Fusarium oxysporum f. sp. albedinis]